MNYNLFGDFLYSQTTSLSAANDTNEPLSFEQWKKRHIPIVSENEYIRYQNYVREWFSKRNEENQKHIDLIRSRMKYMLEQLNVYFSKAERQNWFNLIDTSNDRELLIAIPYFAKKLRQIALFYQRLRHKVQQTKIRTAVAGTKTGTEKILKDYLLEEFTQKDDDEIYLQYKLWKDTPPLSALADKLSLTIEELYDDSDYLGHSPYVPLSSYFDLKEKDLQFLNNQNELSAAAFWLFNTFAFPISANAEILSATNLEDFTNYIIKYIGAPQQLKSKQTITQLDVPYLWDIQAGNNHFYFPFSSFDQNQFNNTMIIPQPLSSLNLEGATAGTTLADSDVIIVRVGDEMKVAWLNNNAQSWNTTTMESYLRSGQTTFIYPFPGYGIVGSQLKWTQPSFVYSKHYPFLSDERKQLVQKNYWSYDFSWCQTNPILVNQTTLINSGAYPATSYEHADKLFINDKQAIWLYRFEEANIPIVPGKQTKILWPYGLVNSRLLSSIDIDLSDVCKPVSVHQIKGGHASHNILEADKIYKIDGSGRILDGAWLSAGQLQNSYLQTSQQQSFAGLFEAGKVTSFVWTGEDIPINELLTVKKHTPGCPFAFKQNYQEFPLCDCGAIYYSPFGHPGSTFDQHASLADFIAEDNNTNLDYTNTTWSDLSGLFITNSNASFAWFKTTPNIGWAPYGQWVTYDGTPSDLILKKGRRYLYRRVGARTGQQHPPLVLFKDNSDHTTAVWVGLTFDKNRNLVNSGLSSIMTLHPGDLIIYERQKFSTYNTLSTIQVDVRPLLINSIWSNYDFVPLKETVYLTWPNNYIDHTELNATDPYQQYPAVKFFDLSAIKGWTVKTPSNASVQFSGVYIAFRPAVTGVYTISVTGIKSDGTPYVFSNIPPITAVSPTSAVQITTKHTFPLPGFVISTPLYGWNYNFNQGGTSTNLGAKPYWAEAFFEKDANTRYGSLIASGRPYRFVDGYLPDRQPHFSLQEIKAGDKISYENKGKSFTWKQPISYRDVTLSPRWCEVQVSLSSQSSLSSIFSLDKDFVSATPLHIDSSIVLSNQLAGSPVEIWYRAIQSFQTVITATFVVSPSSQDFLIDYITPDRPWNVLPNRYFAAVAPMPVTSELYSEQETGALFLPQNLGLTIYNNLGEVVPLSANVSTSIEPTVIVGGRGFTRQDQPTNYILIENNFWIKEPLTSFTSSGNVNKHVAKKHQNFTGYQPSQQLEGLISLNSLFDPWGGSTEEIWIDYQNHPTSFTGVVNVTSWMEDQVLKQTNKRLDCWCVDLYGNQYGLYKNANDCETIIGRLTSTGEWWVRTIDNQVFPASVGLSSIYNIYNSPHLSSIYVDLINNQIYCIDIAENTLFITLSSAILMHDVMYDYDKKQITSSADNFRGLILSIPPQLGVSQYAPLTQVSKPSRIWYQPLKKRILLSTAYLSGGDLRVEIFALDTENQWKDRRLLKLFPHTSSFSLKSLSAVEINNCVLTEIDADRCLVAVSGKDINQWPYIVLFTFNEHDSHTYFCENITVYRSSETINTHHAPFVPDNQLSSIYIVNSGVPFTIHLSAIPFNETHNWTILFGSPITVTNGIFSGTLHALGVHHISFEVNNLYGSTTQSLTLSVV